MTPLVVPPIVSKPRRTGFTLIELLTVIAIIGILAAILIPTVGAVRKTARRAQGVSNIRQVTMTAINFTNDNRGKFVYGYNRLEKDSPALDWSEVLANYAGKKPLFTDLAATPDWFRDPFATPTANPDTPANHHFAPFQFFTSDAADGNALRIFRKGTGLFGVKSPAKQVFFADIFVDAAGNAHGDIWDGPNVGWLGGWVSQNPTDALLRRTPPASYGKSGGQIDFSRDPNQAKFGFLDGHVQVIKKTDFRERYMNPFAN